MATIAEVRQKFPQYADLSDEQLAQGLHKKYYSDLPFEDFSKRVGLQTAPAESPSTEQPEQGTDVGRQAALTGRAVGEGVADTAMAGADLMVNNPMTARVNPLGAMFANANTSPARIISSIANHVAGKQIYDADSFQDLLAQALTHAGAPTPETSGEKLRYAAEKGVTGALTGAGTAGMAGGLTSATRTIVGGAAGGAAAEATKQAGGGPIAQTAAGIVGGLAGAGGGRTLLAEGVKRSFRGGGEEARQRAAENIKAFEDAGTTPSVGQATENRVMQATESLLSKTPGAAGVMARKSETQAAELGANIERLASQLAPKASGEQAGRAITKGVTGEGGFIEQFKAKSSANYDQLDQHVQKNTKFSLPETQKVLGELTTPISGAEKTSKFFINGTINSIKGALDADLASDSGTMPYEAVKKLRSIVGEQLADAPFAGDVPRSQWKKLYAAMSSDLEANAKAVGPEAEKALARANSFHAAGMKRLDAISAVIDKNGGPEKVFQAAISGNKEGATTLRAVMQSLPPDAQKTLSAAVLRRLGRATAGKQDELGEKFSTETFLTNWNGMSPNAKAVLFDRYGPDFRRDMDQVAKVTANLREGSQVFRNPSGTGQATTQAATVATFAVSVLSGNLGAAGTVAGGVTAANLGARLLTHPPFVKWLAKSTRMPVEAVPVALSQLARSDDPLLKEAAAVLAENRKQRANDDGNRDQPEGDSQN